MRPQFCYRFPQHDMEAMPVIANWHHRPPASSNVGCPRQRDCRWEEANAEGGQGVRNRTGCGWVVKFIPSTVATASTPADSIFSSRDFHLDCGCENKLLMQVGLGNTLGFESSRRAPLEMRVSKDGDFETLSTDDSGGPAEVFVGRNINCDVAMFVPSFQSCTMEPSTYKQRKRSTFLSHDVVVFGGAGKPAIFRAL